MIDPSNLLIFLGASLILILAPGPDVLFLISQGVSRGPKAGLETALGLACGNLIHTSAAALGISILFRTSHMAFTALKIAGVLYLLFLAWRTVRKPGQPGNSGREPRPSARDGTFWRGFVMCVLNPKVALFFLAFLPQFTSTISGPIWAQMLFLGAVFTGLVVLVFGVIGILAGTLGARIAEAAQGRAARPTRWIMAGVYAALATRLAFVAR
jgi:threonine/homoserine/homoserine lactone efflux protein